ncbi:hypothetical protein QY048_13830 [Bradyrhizobium sp. WYCCWR 12677]|nr:hypothetical protein [Bradyrhizobium sp. CCBAU 53340]MDN5001963.1 hypothetical protein [Bradyrhizobium sp. WYCCWR 12677]
MDLVLAARTEGALRHFLEHVVTADGFDDFLLGFLAVFIILVVFTGGFRSLAMRRLDRFVGGVNRIGRLGDGGHGFGKRFAMGFDGRRFVRLGNGLGRNHGLGANSRDRRGRLVCVMIVRVVMTMLVMIMRVLVIMCVRMITVAMIIVLVIVMPVIVVIMVMMIVIVIFVLAVMLGIGV